MLTINTNINNLKLQRNLGAVNSAMQQALGRISTGYRINNASDDAAGLVISTALGVQTRGLNVANQNAQMAVNVMQTADGALGQMGDLTMRIRDLATQAANGGYSITERKALELEAKALTSSLEQLVNGTKFNEFKIFEGGTSKGIINEADAIAQGYTIVKTAAQLQAIATGNLSSKYILMNDIDLSSIANFNAIGAGSGAGAFRGTFDGNGYTIKNLAINTSASYQGLFGYTDRATIKNVKLENVNISSSGNYIGALVGYNNDGTTINCSSTGNITGVDYTGGLVGYLYDDGSLNFQNCWVEGGFVNGKNSTGGLIGYVMDTMTTTTLKNMSSSADVQGTDYVGGLVGSWGLYDFDVSNAYATGNVTGVNYVGGLAGRTYCGGSGTLKNSYSTGSVTGANYVGGFIGDNGYVSTSVGVYNSFSTGNVYSASGAISTSFFGGFIGYNSNLITNCFSTGQNMATIGYRGGFVGQSNSGTSTNNSFITQTNGFGAVGNGTAISVAEQNSSFFTPALIQSTLNKDNAANQWDFSGSMPRFKWQIKPQVLTFQIGVDGSALSALTIDLGFSLGGFSADFASADSARSTMVKCDTLLKQINIKRGEIGANVNITGSIIEGNDVTNENLSASKSRIQDADIARESANMVKNQILENATTALLSQSKNFDGQLALQLLSALR